MWRVVLVGWEWSKKTQGTRKTTVIKGPCLRSGNTEYIYCLHSEESFLL